MAEESNIVKKPAELTKEQAIEKLWRAGNLEWKLKGVQKEMRQTVYSSKGKKTTFLCSRRLGKCLVEGTQVITSKGMKSIEDVKPGDLVYGYNYDGSVTLTKVNATVYQGEKEIVELLNGNKVMAECTLDHPWMTYNSHSKKTEEKLTKEILADSEKSRRLKIKREFVKSKCGDVREPHAYAIAALLGDGCSRQGTYQLCISSEDSIIPSYVASILNCKYDRNSISNYTWVLSHNDKLKYRGQKKSQDHVRKAPTCNYYNEWCKGRYAHEKIADLEVIKTWDRESCLNFLAGLIDTDGSVGFRNNRVSIVFTSQSFSLMTAFKFLIYQLFQYDATILQDSRDKYKNGPCYSILLNNNLFCKLALKELSAYIQIPRKKWKNEYEKALEHNSNKEYVGVKRGKTRTAKTWDLSIDNESKLYLLANGMVTHNTFVMMLLAVEHCVKVPNSIVKVLLPKKKDAKAVSRDQMKVILEDCPPDIKPEWMEADKLFIFPNGSEIQMAGTDGGSAESVRGSRCHLAILDEAGFMDYNEFSYIVQSIIMPTLLTTKGKIILASTPSKEPDHPFMTDYVLPARKDGTLIEYDIYSNPMIDEKDIEEIAAEYPGGRDDPAFLREFMLQCDVVSDDFIVPEFTADARKDIIGERKSKPAYFDFYVSGDPAATDLTHVLFGYYDYLNAKLVVADELTLGGPGESITTQDIADGIRRKEKLNFSNPLTGEIPEPYLRVMDYNNKILMFDLDKEHGLRFIPTAKDNKEAQINKLRMMVRQGKIEISPKCQNLIYQLQAGRWKKTKDGTINGFQRLKGMKDQNLKPNHCDGVDALLYLVRNVDFNKNPYPPGFLELRDFDTGATLFMPERVMKSKQSDIEDLVNSIINRRKK